MCSLSQVSQEDGVLVFAEGEVASAFGRMLLGDNGKAELLAEIVTKDEGRVVAEVETKMQIPKLNQMTKLKQLEYTS